MKTNVNPIVLIGVGVAAAIVLVIVAIYVMAPHPPPVTIPAPGMMDEGAIKRENVRKANAGTPPADASTAKPASGSDRTGD